jgi:hypothetical protein
MKLRRPPAVIGRFLDAVALLIWSLAVIVSIGSQSCGWAAARG